MNAYKDKIAETERVKERKRARVERVARDVHMVAENRDEQVAFDMRTYLAVTSEKTNTKRTDRIRDIHVGKSGSEAAGEEDSTI